MAGRDVIEWGETVVAHADAGPFSVLVVSHTGELGGAERALLRLITASDPRYAISLLTMSDGPFVDEARSVGLKVRVLDGGEVVRVTRAQAGSMSGIISRLSGTLALARELSRAIREDGSDLMVANSLKSAVLLGVVAGRRRWVWHLHDRLASDYLSAPVVVALRLLARFGPRRIVANSHATAATAGRLPPGRVTVAYPGLDASAFDRPKRAPGRGPIGIVGRIAPTKGQLEFVNAAERVSRTRPRERFCIVGAALFEDAAYAAMLSEQIAHSGVGDRIEQMGWSDSPTVAFRRLRLLVHASPVPEPFGQVIVEAIAVGTPVVATDAGGAREIIDPRSEAVEVADGVRRAPYGLLVRPADADALAVAIEWVLDHRDDTASAACAAHEDARTRFTIDRTWSIVSRVWQSAAG